ncbi:hypothetical protein BN1723_019393 [Verticillium longisporum]|uniref:Uncharacterized protein n=1 Tax=Verticillium longisporum TaxID=100787 RepID=A0A0G4NCD8_VERLO|nr:hypothetical protein BN1723_019393 [Verticillium longisporum]
MRLSSAWKTNWRLRAAHNLPLQTRSRGSSPMRTRRARTFFTYRLQRERRTTHKSLRRTRAARVSPPNRPSSSLNSTGRARKEISLYRMTSPKTAVARNTWLRSESVPSAISHDFTSARIPISSRTLPHAPARTGAKLAIW